MGNCDIRARNSLPPIAGDDIRSRATAITVSADDIPISMLYRPHAERLGYLAGPAWENRGQAPNPH